ncbi:MAG: hypothetical protein KF723_14140 [Rhizobiaceae bacterium]|nr:hypothetical protein [Rhizobiaceae bacterium]
MTDMSDPEPGTLPAAVPFLLNASLAAGLGLFVGGWIGAALAFALLASVFGLFWLARWSRRHSAAISTRLQAVRTAIRPVLGLLLLPFAMLLTIPIVALYSAWLRVERFFKAPDVDLATPLVRSIRRFGSFLASGFTPRNLPGTAVNLLLVLVLGCVLIGIEVAFYAALAAVPIMLVTLMMVAIESSREPDED